MSEVVLKIYFKFYLLSRKCILNFSPSTLGNWEYYFIVLTKSGQGSKISST